MPRFRGKIPFNPTVTQAVKNALFEAGREDLIQALQDSGLAAMEEEIADLRKRIVAIEQEKVKFQTESGVHRILKSTAKNVTFDWVKIAAKGFAGLTGTALFAWVVKLAWKGLHSD